MKEQEEKFAEVGHPDYVALMKIEEVMRNKLGQEEKADRIISNEIQSVINERFDRVEETTDQLITKKLKENSREVEQVEAKNMRCVRQKQNICGFIKKGFNN